LSDSLLVWRGQHLAFPPYPADTGDETARVNARSAS